MKVRELIEQLEIALSLYGDLQVLVDYEDFGEITKCRNYTTGEMCMNIKIADAEEVEE